MLLARRDRQRIVHQDAALGYDAGGAFGDPAELDDPLGNEVHVLLDCLVDLVEQLVERDEAGAFHVPVGLLALGLEVDAVRQALVEEVDGLDPARLREVVLGRVESCRLRTDGFPRTPGGGSVGRAGGDRTCHA